MGASWEGWAAIFSTAMMGPLKQMGEPRRQPGESGEWSRERKGDEGYVIWKRNTEQTEGENEEPDVFMVSTSTGILGDFHSRLSL